MRGRIAGILGLTAGLALGCADAGDGFGAGTGDDDDTTPASSVCEPGGSSSYFQFEGEFWTCNLPPPAGGAVDMVGYEGATSLVNGASAVFSLDWTGETLTGKDLVVGVQDDGFYRDKLTNSPDPYAIVVEILQEVTESFVLWVGVADGSDEQGYPVTGEYVQIPIDITPVLTGDVQVSVHWDTDNDVDLFVVEPSGEVVWHANPISATGGQLDLDSNALCDIDGINNENIFWPDGAAPVGEYEVWTNFYDSCDGLDVAYRVTVVLGGEEVEAFDGAYAPEDANQGETADEITTFSWDG